MGLREAIRLSFSNIRSHKLRNSLAVLSVMIGIAAVIAVVTMTTGFQTALLDVLTQDLLRANNISVAVEGSQSLFGADRVFTDNDVDAVLAIDHVEAADVFAPVNGNPLRYQGRQLNDANARITTSTELIPLDAGRHMELTGMGEIVIGYETAAEICERLLKEDLDDPTSEQEDEIETRCSNVTTDEELSQMVLGQTVELSYLKTVEGERSVFKEDLQIVGLLKKSQFLNGTSSYVSPQYHGYTESFDGQELPVYTGIIVSVADTDYVEAVAEDLEEFFLTYNADARKLVGDGREIEVSTLTEIVEEIQGQFAQFGLWIGTVALVALLVGMIGIMNIMLVTVKERTKEIGVMKATGATRGGVMRLFLTESLIICVIGAFFGIAGGIGLGVLFNQLTSALFELDEAIPLVFVWGAYIIAVITGIIVGGVSGLYPAYPAAQVNPIDALRYE